MSFERNDTPEIVHLTPNDREHLGLLRMGARKSPRVQVINRYIDLDELTHEIGNRAMVQLLDQDSDDIVINDRRLPSSGVILDLNIPIEASSTESVSDVEAVTNTVMLLEFLALAEKQTDVVLFSEREATQTMLDDIRGEIEEHSKLIRLRALNPNNGDDYGDVIDTLREMNKAW